MMESESNVYVQREDNEVDQSSPACLRVPLILRKIMQHFSNRELIQYSVVNKLWNYEARSLMRYRGQSRACLEFQFAAPCQKLPLFASHVRQMNVVPFCGITMDMEKEEHHITCQLSSSEILDPIFHVILDRLSWTYFLVMFHDQWELNTHCPAFILAKKVLQDCCGLLETLFLRVPRNHVEFLRQVLPNSTFPRLKILYLLGGFTCPLKVEQRMFIKTMVSRAPNLQELYLDDVDGLTDLTENFLEGSSAVLDVDIDPINQEICEGLIGALRSEYMHLQYIGENFRMERLDRIVPVVLQTSRTALRSLDLNSVFALCLMRYGIRLENVTQLTIGMNDQLEHDVPPNFVADVTEFFRLFQDFDFTHIFPKLERIRIIHSDGVSPWDISQFIEHENAIPREPSATNRAVNIKHLTLRDSGTYVPLLASMFPQVESLEVVNTDGPAPPYELIWEHWATLKELVVELERTQPFTENVDSLICGIFPQEVVQLRGKDEEYLKAVNIVPVMPSITCMKELRTFRFLRRRIFYPPLPNDPTFIFSKVSGLIAFSRCPNLSVTLEINSEWANAWSHMKNYASVVAV